MVVVLAGNLAALVVAVLGCWNLVDQAFAVTGSESLMGLVVALTGCWALLDLTAGYVNLDAAVFAAPPRCGLT